MEPVIGVGIIGVTPGTDWKRAGWSAIAHLPALKALHNYEIRAVASRNRANAEQVARQYDIAHVFEDVESLCNCRDVDLVVITVRVPAHLPLVRAAISAGKTVLCEWPLGKNVSEAEVMMTMARDRGIRSVVGLQARAAPAIRYVRDLIGDGYVGEVLSTSMIGSGMSWGPGMSGRDIYSLYKENGTTLLSAAAGHALDALCFCLGEFEFVTAVSALRRPRILFPDEQRVAEATAEDQWAITGQLVDGAVASVHYRGGSARGSNFVWEINGTEGDITLTCDYGAIQLFQLTVAGSDGADMVEEIDIPAHYYVAPPLPDPVLNVAQMYALLAQDMHSGTDHCPDFSDALVRHRMLAAIERAAETGTRQSYL